MVWMWIRIDIYCGKVAGLGGLGNGEWRIRRAVGVETGASGVGTGEWGAESEK